MSGTDWVARLRERAAQPPLRPRDALVGIGTIGSIEPALARRAAAAGLPLRPAGASAWQVEGPLDAGLEAIAHWLAREGIAGRWRDEKLAVTDEAGRVVGAIERAAVRPLGIATHAVHLVGRADDGRVWVQQRALDKATDPGLWDTLMGGLVAHGESDADTLERETWEEAGLRVAELRELAPHGRVTVRRPVDNGYMVEHIDVFAARVPAGLEPRNQDGEVERFDLVDAQRLVAMLREGAFTLEAALVLLLVNPVDGMR